MKKRLFKLIKFLFLMLFVLMVGGIVIVISVRLSVRNLIRETPEDVKADRWDTAVILGASVQGDRPSLMLRDRLDTGITLYKEGKVRKLLMSGDGRTVYYNEVETMKKYAMDAGIPASAIETDPKGLSTYESVVRLPLVAPGERVIFVSQRFHLARALYMARYLGIDAIACPAEDIAYQDLPYLELREAAATVKDFFGVRIRG